jgi:type II secretory pathway pseudopilin PulG
MLLKPNNIPIAHSGAKFRTLRYDGYKYSGFTLIEIMFIVLLLAFVVLQVAQTQQQKAEANIVERAAGDMNNWELAVINYYNQNNNIWPSTLKLLTTTSPPMMPTAALCSQFAVTTTASADCGSYAEYTGQNKTSYYVLSVQTTSNNVASLLAAKLQNSWLTNNGKTVNTAIPAPLSSSYGANRGWIVSAGLVTFASSTGGSKSGTTDQLGSQIYLPNCPSGFEGHIITSPEQYDSNSTAWGMHLAQTTPTGGQDDTTLGSSSVVFNTNVKDQHGQVAYAITTNDIPDNSGTEKNTGGIRHLGFFMTFCLPQQLDSNGTFVQSNWYTNFVNSDWLQDGQCSSSWQTYLSGQHNTHPQCINTTDSKFVYPQGQNSLGTATGY